MITIEQGSNTYFFRSANVISTNRLRSAVDRVFTMESYIYIGVQLVELSSQNNKVTSSATEFNNAFLSAALKSSIVL
jgi:hypothetical protein